MCGGGGGGGSDEYAEQQRKEQEERERRIRAGLSQLEAIFEGGTQGSGRAEEFDAAQTYYDAEGNVVYAPPGSSEMRGFVDPVTGETSFVESAGPAPEGAPNVHLGDSDFRLRMGPNSTPTPAYAPSDQPYISEDIMGSTVEYEPIPTQYGDFALNSRTGEGVNLRNGATPAEQTAEDILQQRIENGELFTGTTTEQGFGDDFYNQQQQAYLEFANPQVDEQFEDAQENLTFALSRAGTLNSSTAADRFGEAEQDYGEARGMVADRAGDVANQTRQAVADERARLTSLIHATGDPSASLAGIGQVLDSLRNTPAFDPIGPIFQNVTAGIGSYAQGRQYADIQQRVNDMFRSPNQGSGRTVG